MSSPSLRLSELNKVSPAEFTRSLEAIYEKSPWVPEAAATQRPFESLPALAKALARVVATADPSKQLALMRAHPVLALKKQEQLTVSSQQEQARSGMDSLTAPAQKQFTRYNEQYQQRHGFPFITCVSVLDSDAIVRQAGERVFNSTETERRRALKEIERIAWVRLQKTVVDDSPRATPSTVGIEPAVLGASRSSIGTKITDCQYGKVRNNNQNMFIDCRLGNELMCLVFCICIVCMFVRVVCAC